MKITFWERLKKRFLGTKTTSRVEDQVNSQIEDKIENQVAVVSPPQAQNTQNKDIVQSRRVDDMSAEAQLAIFLDAYLYARFPNADSFRRIERMHSKTDQLAGVDVCFTGMDGTVYNVDEKAQLYYLNKDLPTFAFEIQFLRDGRVTTGWLCNNTLKTDLYLLIWPFATQDTPKGIRWDQFTKADCLLIQKKRLLTMLERDGLAIKRMQQDAAQFRKAGHIGKATIDGVRGAYYFASDPKKYREAPINIVVTKDRLLSIAQRRYIVTREGVEVK